MRPESLIPILFFVSIISFSQNHKISVDEQEVKRINNTLQTLIEENNGVPVPIGYNSHLVAFLKKTNFDPKHDILAANPKDFSLNSQFLCSGTLLTRRWALTRAKPIAYYPIGSYWMVSQHTLILPIDIDIMNVYEIDFIIIHPDHHPGDVKTDLALVRSSEELNFSFETRNVDLSFNMTKTNCKMAVWSWFFRELPNTKFETVDKGELSFIIDPDGDTCIPEQDLDYFICLTHENVKRRPCGVNSGAPVLCGPILVGIYVGENGTVVCDPKTQVLDGYSALKVDTGFVQRWITEMISIPEYDFQEDGRTVTLAKCGSN